MHRIHTHDARFRRARTQHGAVLVEFAFIFPFLLLLVVGAVDVGGAANTSFTAASAIQTAARTGSALGKTTGADHEILVSLLSSLGTENLDDLVRVIIYEADEPDAAPHRRCFKAASITRGGNWSKDCNIYSNAKLKEIAADPVGTASQFNRADCGGEPHRFWCPSERENTQDATSHGGLDHLGVWIEIDHKTTTGMFAEKINITDYTTSQIQPYAGD